MERRRQERTETNVHLSCRMPAMPCRAIVHDLSHSGCRIELGDANIELGGTALLDFPEASRFPGRVVWISGKQAGIRFERRLSGLAAVALGLDQPEEPAAAEPLEPAEDCRLGGLLQHWMRQLTSRSS